MVRVGGVVLFVIAAALLTSFGGLGIVASPITLPLMYVVVVAHPTLSFRIAGVVIGGLTGLEGGWGLGVLLFGYDGLSTLVTGLVVGSLTVIAFARVGSRPARTTTERQA